MEKYLPFTNLYRLTSTAFDRADEERKVSCQKIYYIAVEGNLTEREYLENISAYRETLRITATVNVEVLNRSTKDNGSAPKDVIELLEEYVELRSNPDILSDIPENFREEYSKDFIRKFLDNPNSIARRERNRFIMKLREIGYDIKYRLFLKKYENNFDEFCIMIDRDSMTHSKQAMEECIEYCSSKGYKCYISNPCFEFWLLLHLSDVKKEYADKLDEIRENKKITNHHTFISGEVSNKAHHGKSGICFKENYLQHVDEAIERSKGFETDNNELVNHIGSNIGMLIEDMRKFNDLESKRK